MLIRLLLIAVLAAFHAGINSQCFTIPAQVCEGDCGPIFYLSNDPPGTTYQWSIDCGTITNDMQANPHLACFLVPGTCTIQLIIQQPGQSPDTCQETVEVFPNVFHDIEEIVCSGDSIEVNGTYYTEGMYLDTIFGGTANGCDSILQITILELPADTSYETYLGCNGDGYSVTVNNVVYDEVNPSGTEALTGSDGCDSIIIIDLVFQSLTFGFETYSGCEGDGYFVVVDSTLYDESNPSGTEILTGTNGCDSIVTITLTFLPLSYDTITYLGCTGDTLSIMVGDSLFNEANPDGIVVFQTSTCDSIIVVDLQFDTINATLTLSGHQLCASPTGMQYTWYNCSGAPLPDTTECITVNGVGCACVIIDNGICIDTVCQEYTICDATCEIIAPDGVCTGDSVLITVTGTYTASATLNWTITSDSSTAFNVTGTDSIWMVYYTPGCYPVDLNVFDLGCITTCTDTICVAEKPIADFCCDQVRCDSCATITVWLSGNPPWDIAIYDGITIDTISGITTSLYDYQVCPPYDSIVYYQLLWVQDTNGICSGSIINDSVLVYLEERPVASITIEGDSLCAQPPGYAYGWYDCQNTMNIAFSQCFIPTASGCYCVTVSTFLTDCIDSACVNFIISSESSPKEPDELTYWYDPYERAIFVSSISDDLADIQIQLVDVHGRNISYVEKTFINDETLRIRLAEQIPSVLFFTLSSEKYRFTRGIFIPR